MLERPERFQEVQKLSHELMQGIASVVPILPVSLVSTVFLEDMVTEMDILEIEARSNRLIKKLKEKGAPILESSHSTRARAIADAVDIMLLRRMISRNGDRFKVIPEEKTLLAYYANAIGHWR
jgi:glycerol-3-phosphate O-acyltransferase